MASPRAAVFGLFGAMLATAGVSAALLRPVSVAPPAGPAGEEGRPPGPGTALGYVSSRACVACHPAEHASFRRTYHRTMTQAATPETVAAPLDGRLLDEGGRTVRLERRGEEVWATLPDPDAEVGRAAPEVTRRVVLTTGSHREQAFWVAGRRPGDLRLVPFVWMVQDRAFLPRQAAFVTPPDVPLPRVRWGSSCIACHAVAGEPRHDLASDAFDTRVAELGVACEACHGPGAAHAARYRDPVLRYAARRAEPRAPDPTIVHPGRLSPERSAAVCGQCHAYAFPRDEPGWWRDGYSRTFRAGDALEPSRALIRPAADTPSPGAPEIDAPADAIFWPDGSVRVGGREYNGLIASPCWERGSGTRKLTCLSCHAMHSGDPAGQIAPSKTDDRACTSCHDQPRDRNHGHHAAGSVGSACVSCHMPKTSYALLSAVRSHRIDIPSAAVTASTGKPNACNLCHLDRTLAWTARWLSEWYGAPPVAVSEGRARTAAGIYEGIAGDAGVRAIVADALGSEAAARACRADFFAPLLDVMTADPYAAVRFIAERSRRKLGPAPGGSPLGVALVVALVAARDDHPVTIAE